MMGEIDDRDDRIRDLEAENARLRELVRPACAGCGLRPNLESPDAVIWCDECVAENARLRELVRRVATEASVDYEDELQPGCWFCEMPVRKHKHKPDCPAKEFVE